MKKFGVGIIGFGYWGRILFKYFRNHPGFDVKRIATRHPQEIRSELPPEIPVCSPDELLSDGEITALIIATPIGTHFEYAVSALNRGLHLFVEKPLTLSGTEAFEIGKSAGKKGLNVFTDYTFTFSPAIRRMVELVREGAVGKVEGAVFQIRQLGHFSKNSVYVDLGCHALSVLDLIAPLHNMSCERTDLVERDGYAESGIIDFRPLNSGGLRGTIILSFNHQKKTRNMAIYGDKGSVVYDMMAEKPLCMVNYRVERDKSRDPFDKIITEFDFDEFNTVERAVDNFHRVLSGEMEPNIESAIRVSRVLEKMERPNRQKLFSPGE